MTRQTPLRWCLSQTCDLNETSVSDRGRKKARSHYVTVVPPTVSSYGDLSWNCFKLWRPVLPTPSGPAVIIGSVQSSELVKNVRPAGSSKTRNNSSNKQASAGVTLKTTTASALLVLRYKCYRVYVSLNLCSAAWKNNHFPHGQPVTLDLT